MKAKKEKSKEKRNIIKSHTIDGDCECMTDRQSIMRILCHTFIYARILETDIGQVELFSTPNVLTTRIFVYKSDFFQMDFQMR